MANQPIYLNGVVFKPSSIDRKEDKIGDSKVMANGYKRFYHRAFKNQWQIAWNGVTTDVLNNVRAIYRLTSTFTFVDEQGNSYTVLCLPGGFSSTLDAANISINNVVRYDVQLTIDEV